MATHGFRKPSLQLWSQNVCVWGIYGFLSIVAWGRGGTEGQIEPQEGV